MGEFAATLRGLPVLAGLGKDELAAIERSAQVVECTPGEGPCPSTNDERRLFVLLEGELEVSLRLRQGERCGGEVRSTLDRPGEVLGWALLMKRDHLIAKARCVTPSRLLAVDLVRLPSHTGLAVATNVAIQLYGQMQRMELCPRRRGSLEAV